MLRISALLSLTLLLFECGEPACEIPEGCVAREDPGAGTYWICETSECRAAERCLRLGESGTPNCVRLCADDAECPEGTTRRTITGEDRVCANDRFGSDFLEP